MKLKDLPWSVFWGLCRLLDSTESPALSWRELLSHYPGKAYMPIDVSAFARESMRPGGSPAQAVLQDFIVRGITVDDLFLMLSKMSHVEGMKTIQQYASPSLHHLLELHLSRGSDRISQSDHEAKKYDNDPDEGPIPPTPPHHSDSHDKKKDLAAQGATHSSTMQDKPTELVGHVAPRWNGTGSESGDSQSSFSSVGISGLSFLSGSSSTTTVTSTSPSEYTSHPAGNGHSFLPAHGSSYPVPPGSSYPSSYSSSTSSYSSSPPFAVPSSLRRNELPPYPPSTLDGRVPSSYGGQWQAGGGLGVLLAAHAAQPFQPQKVTITPDLPPVVLPPSLDPHGPAGRHVSYDVPLPLHSAAQSSSLQTAHPTPATPPTANPVSSLDPEAPPRPGAEPSAVLLPYSVLTFSYSELSQATDCFTHGMVGIGSFGTVFRAKVRGNGPYAIKKLHSQAEMEGGFFPEALRLESFKQELLVLTRYHHRNILSLVAYCNDGPPCLVYEYMENGSLADCLLGRRDLLLTWEVRLEIARQVADALHFLHTVNKPQCIVHGDVKSANILLDLNLVPKLSDFGLARECLSKSSPKQQSTYSTKTNVVMGTLAYMAPEFRRNQKLTPKTDVYSFGVVLLELYTGMPAHDPARKETLTIFLEHLIEDPDSHHDEITHYGDQRAGWPPETGISLFDITTVCLSSGQKQRPSMDQVRDQVALLTDGAAQQQSRYPPPYSC